MPDKKKDPLNDLPEPQELDFTEALTRGMYAGDQRDGRPILPVKFKRLHKDAVIPKRGTILSAGYDLVVPEDFYLKPDVTEAVPLGFSTEIHPMIHGRIESRSGMAVKGVVVQTGVIDADYRGEWKVILRWTPNEIHEVDTTESLMKLEAGSKIAQVVFRPTVAAHWQEVSELSDTQRGSGGFGSTGA